MVMVVSIQSAVNDVHVSSSDQAVGVGEREGETFSDLSRRTISISSAEGESPGKRITGPVRANPPSHTAGTLHFPTWGIASRL